MHTMLLFVVTNVDVSLPSHYQHAFVTGEVIRWADWTDTAADEEREILVLCDLTEAVESI